MDEQVWYYQAKEHLQALLRYLGEDPEREGLKETPDRVLKSWSELFSGYKVEIKDLFKTFDGEGYDELILLKNVEFVSFCEHHWLPFSGWAHIAYIPAYGKVVGISKLARLLEAYSRRLQVQERLTNQITSALDRFLQPLGSACVIEATHTCISCRGVCKQQARMLTSSLTGAFLTEPEARAEFFSLIRS